VRKGKKTLQTIENTFLNLDGHDVNACPLVLKVNLKNIMSAYLS